LFGRKDNPCVYDTLLITLFCLRHQTQKLTSILRSKRPRIHISFCFIIWVVFIIVSDRAILMSMCATRQRTSRTKRMQQIILLSAKEIQRTFQLNYPYQAKVQRSWLKLLNDSICDGSLLQCLSYECLYKELKT